MTVEDYQVGESSGEVLKFPNGEYLIIEQKSDEAYSLAWSSALPVVALIKRATQLLNKYSTFTSGVLRLSDGHFLDGNAKQIIGMILKSPDHVRFFRLDSEEFSFGWKARVAIHSDYPQIKVNECGFSSFASFDSALCKELLERSATDRLGTDVETSIERASTFLTRVTGEYSHRKHPDSTGEDSMRFES
ncbi:MAG: hypothetical protein EKK34_25255 [Mycobacterium sp.]|nr:MAG: hypothetical protein EKK34_25255 [Mycobacterium sp.]